MSEFRTYVVGLPVVVTVRDDGTVAYEVDTTETGTSLWEDEENCSTYGGVQVEADIVRVETDHDPRVAGWRQ